MSFKVHFFFLLTSLYFYGLPAQMLSIAIMMAVMSGVLTRCLALSGSTAYNTDDSTQTLKSTLLILQIRKSIPSPQRHNPLESSGSN